MHSPDTGVGVKPKPRTKRRPQGSAHAVSNIVWPNGMAKVATLETYINTCLKLCLIVLSLFGIALLKQLKESDVPRTEIERCSEPALAPKAYPISPTVLPVWDDSFSTHSEKGTSQKKKSPQ